MRFDVLTLFPDMIIDYCSQSIIGRAIESQIIYINTVNPRDYTEDKHKKVEKTEEVTTTEEKAEEEPAPEKPKRGRKPKKKEDE